MRIRKLPVPSQNASIGKRQVILLKAEQVIRETANLCRDFGAKEVILYGSRAKETARERSDIDIAVTVSKILMHLSKKWKICQHYTASIW